MTDTKVETISRLAQWKIENFSPCSFKKSDPFKVGIWNWQLSIEKNRQLYIRLFPEPSRLSKEQPPLARFVLRVSNTGANRKQYISPIHERPLRTYEDFVWSIDSLFHGRLIIDVEFLDLKICPLDAMCQVQNKEQIPIGWRMLTRRRRCDAEFSASIVSFFWDSILTLLIELRELLDELVQ